MKNIVVKDCTFVLSSGTGDITIDTAPSSKVKADGKEVYTGDLQISIKNFTSPTITVAKSGSGSGILKPTAQKTKVEGKFVVLEGDQTQITVNGQATSGSSTIPMSEIVTVTIQKANQDKVKGN